MNYVVAVFKLRSQALKFYNFLKKNGLKVNIIATPKSVGVTCGVCVKISVFDVSRAKMLLNSSGATGLTGFYSISKRGVETVAKRI